MKRERGDKNIREERSDERYFYLPAHQMGVCTRGVSASERPHRSEPCERGPSHSTAGNKPKNYPKTLSRTHIHTRPPTTTHKHSRISPSSRGRNSIRTSSREAKRKDTIIMRPLPTQSELEIATFCVKRWGFNFQMMVALTKYDGGFLLPKVK